MRLFTRVLLLAAFAGLVVLGTCFTTLNAEKVGVDFVFGKLPEVEVWVVTLGAFTLGLVFALLVAGTELFRTSLLARRYRKQIRRLEAELHELRTLPLSTSDAARRAPALDDDGPALPIRSAAGRSV